MPIPLIQVGGSAALGAGTWLLTPDSFGPFRLGMSVEQAKLVDPDLLFGGGSQFDGCQSGINLHTDTFVIFDPRDHLVSISSPSAQDWVTPEGFKDGDTQGKARKIFGPEVPAKKLLGMTHFLVGPKRTAQYTFKSDDHPGDPYHYYAKPLPDAATATTVTLNVPGACVDETTE